MIIGLLECDHVSAEYRSIAGDYRDMFARLFDQHAPEVRLKPFDVINGELPASAGACDGYVCTGSRYSAYDDVDWIDALKGFVRELHGRKKPFVGICFGHQVLAEALGGRVTQAKQGWGVGVHAVQIACAEPWMRPPASECRLHYMHQDQVQQLPEHSVLLGGSDHCPVAMYRVGTTMLGIQAHPEFPAPYSEALMQARIERIGEDKVQTGLASLSQATDEGTVARWIAAFLKGGPVETAGEGGQHHPAQLSKTS